VFLRKKKKQAANAFPVRSWVRGVDLAPILPTSNKWPSAPEVTFDAFVAKVCVWLFFLERHTRVADQHFFIYKFFFRFFLILNEGRRLIA
jgi:hypothetical protein